MLLDYVVQRVMDWLEFQWAPTLGGECYFRSSLGHAAEEHRSNGHPPLGVNATFRGAKLYRQLT